MLKSPSNQSQAATDGSGKEEEVERLIEVACGAEVEIHEPRVGYRAGRERSRRPVEVRNT